MPSGLNPDFQLEAIWDGCDGWLTVHGKLDQLSLPALTQRVVEFGSVISRLSKRRGTLSVDLTDVAFTDCDDTSVITGARRVLQKCCPLLLRTATGELGGSEPENRNSPMDGSPVSVRNYREVVEPAGMSG